MDIFGEIKGEIENGSFEYNLNESRIKDFFSIPSLFFLFFFLFKILFLVCQWGGIGL